MSHRVTHRLLRHADPRQVTITVGAPRRIARVEIEDDGSGFNVAEAEGRRPGMGLYTMRERAALVGGGCEIRSDRANGTRIVVTIPIAIRGDDVQIGSTGHIPVPGNEGTLER